MARESSSSPPSSLSEVVQSMEEAIVAAKQLPFSAGDPTRTHQILASLHLAHRNLSTFLAPAPPPEEQSVSSSDEPMQLEDDEPVVAVEERLRDCSIHHHRGRRQKRRRPPSATTEAAAAEDEIAFVGGGGYDPYATRLRALELVYQFHA